MADADDDEEFMYIQSTDRVVHFNEHLLERSDIKVISKTQATRIIKRSEERRAVEVKATRHAQVKEAMNRVGKRAGFELVGKDFEDDETREARETREHKKSIAAAGADIHPGSDENPNNDPNLPRGTVVGAADKADQLAEQHEGDMNLAELLAQAQHPDNVASNTREPEEQGPAKRRRAAS